MLKLSDCRSGVEIIAIKNVAAQRRRPPLSIGCTYTIKDSADHYYDYNKSNQRVNVPCICVDEVPVDRDGNDWAYLLHQFKLRDPFELDRLFKLDNMDKDVLKEDDFESI